MFKYRGHHLYSKAELESHDCLKDYIAIPTTYLYISSWLNRSEIYDCYLKTYDSAVPQPWWDVFFAKNKVAPEAVWCYDEPHNLFGTPVFWNDIFYRFGKDVNQAIADGTIKFEQAD